MHTKKHPSKVIECAIEFAEEHGWRYVPPGNSAHCWGKLYCSLAEREGCKMSIWSTPRDEDSHAKRIRQNVKACSHGKD
ncbi:MAG: hypothetical protein AB7F64_04770 [Gammaproteobacteria bacterium]